MGGVYKVVQQYGNGVKGTRTLNATTDTFVFYTSQTDGGCQVDVTASLDTGYCDIRNLWCGSMDGCSFVYSDFLPAEMLPPKSPGNTSFYLTQSLNCGKPDVHECGPRTL